MKFERQSGPFSHHVASKIVGRGAKAARDKNHITLGSAELHSLKHQLAFVGYDEVMGRFYAVFLQML
ncbi:hypothetical protein D3C87_1215700 [compost metagenome]